MPKGKAWSMAETQELLELRKEGLSVSVIASRMGKTEQAIMKKLQRLGLKVVQLKNSYGTTTSELVLPGDLPSVEEALCKVAAAMKALETPGLSKTEIMRLRALIQASGIYQKRLAEYINYAQIERKLVELEAKYAALVSAQGSSVVVAPEPRISRQPKRRVAVKPLHFVHSSHGVGR